MSPKTTMLSKRIRPTHTALLLIVLLSVTALVLSACAQGQAEISPPEIRYGEDLCAGCNMIISEPRFAAGFVVELTPGRYESLAFDDIGDMLIHRTEHDESAIVAWYVHDHATEEWLDATGAVFVQSTAVASPMGHGIAAFADEENAGAFAASVDGTLLTWGELSGEPSASAGSGHHHE